MALPAPGTATRDGSCCCGGDCCDTATVCLSISGTPTAPAYASLVGEYDLAAVPDNPCAWSETGTLFPSEAWWWRDVAGVADLQWFSSSTFVNYIAYSGPPAKPAFDTDTCYPWGPYAIYQYIPPSTYTDTGLTGSVAAGPCGDALMSALKRAAGPEPPCRWRGDELAGGERSALALDHRRKWFRCGKPDFPRLGLPVTGCRTCKAADMRCSKAGCTGYEPADVDGRPDV